MEIKVITDKNTWENFFLKQKDKTFLQSWAWGEFQKNMGNKIWRLGVYEEENLQAVALVVKIEAKRGTFFEIQHAIVAKESLRVLVEEVKKIGAQEGISFLRIAPLQERNEENKKFMKDLGFREAPMHANAYESTWKLDISPTDEELLGAMRKTTRYLIRQALKNEDIIIEQSTKKEDVKVFAELNKKVGTRQQFVPFSQAYLKNEFDAFHMDDQTVLFLGKYQGKVVASALVIFWSGIGFYHQAASLGEYAKYSVPYLVQWEAIKEAKRRGCTLYDFWGFIDPKKHPKHPWAGPTLFKMGFGGKSFEYVKTQDYPLSWKYWPTAIFETIRAKRRGL